MHRLSPFPLIREAWSSLRGSWARITGVMVGFHLLLLVIVSPLIGWLFREALRANGMVALDINAVRITSGIGITILLLVAILVLAFWVVSLQFATIVVMVHRARAGEPLTARGVWQDLARAARKLLRPSSLPLFFYLFFIVPLSGFGFVSALSQGIAVPSFISGELLKSPVSATVWILFLLLLAILNLRFSLSLPIFTLTPATGGRALRRSWRLTGGWAAFRLILAVTLLLIAASIASLILVLASIIPTAVSDAVSPASSPFVAAYSLGVAQVAGMALTGVFIAMVCAVLLALMRQREDQQPPEPRSDSERRPAWLLVGAGLVLAIALGTLSVNTMVNFARQPATLVLGHRGFSDNGAENTIGGLEAAAAAGADLTEIDVMQTADEKFVVMHDANLARLTGENLNVRDLTQAELMQMTVTDQYGHTGKIPSLEEYVNRARELDMPLLIEIKLGGLDTPDHVDQLVEELDRLDAIDSNIFHTLDAPSVERLKRLRPDATVGYILAFAGIDIPSTPADFVVVEEWSATEEMQRAAERKGLGFFSWTVNEEAGIRELLRRDVDGIITDHPDVAVDARAEMEGETGLAGSLADALQRFVVVF